VTRQPVTGPCARRGAFAAAALCLIVFGGGARRGEVRPTSIAIQPLVDPAPASREGGTEPLADGGPLVALLVLSVTPGIEVHWRPVDPGGPEVLALLPPAAVPALPESVDDPEDPPSPSPAIRSARAMLETLPRSWQKRSIKKMLALGLSLMDEPTAGLMVDALAERAAGDPLGAAALLERARAREGAQPLLGYLLAAARAEAGDLQGAASAIHEMGERLGELPGPLVSIGRAMVDAAEGSRDRSLGRLTSVVESQPALAEAFLLRAMLSVTWCDLYDQRRILDDLDAAVRASPCCPTCSLSLAEMVCFTDRSDTVPLRLRTEAGCRTAPLDSMRDRALALAWAGAGSLDEAMRAAAGAESRDASALRRGLAPAYLLAGDYAHLNESYDPEADLRLTPEESVEHHLHSGLNAFWQGKPSRAAELFERAEEHRSSQLRGDPDLDARMQWMRTLKIRAYLSAGRLEEARSAADSAREPGRGSLNGLLIYSSAVADLASGHRNGAVLMIRRLTIAGLKFWRYLLDAEIALQEGDAGAAQSALSLASQGIDVQTTVCPGVLVEPYMLQAQARTLLALGRPGPAAHLLERLVASGSRGLFAPDMLVPAWGLLGRAREALGDRPGAMEAWNEVISRWGHGEATPALAEARREAARLLGTQ